MVRVTASGCRVRRAGSEQWRGSSMRRGPANEGGCLALLALLKGSRSRVHVAQ